MAVWRTRVVVLTVCYYCLAAVHASAELERSSRDLLDETANAKSDAEFLALIRKGCRRPGLPCKGLSLRNLQDIYARVKADVKRVLEEEDRKKSLDRLENLISAFSSEDLEERDEPLAAKAIPPPFPESREIPPPFAARGIPPDFPASRERSVLLQRQPPLFPTKSPVSDSNRLEQRKGLDLPREDQYECPCVEGMYCYPKCKKELNR